jgi:pimeloyl-ACP methyl ester carboxylesterase
MSNSRAKLLLLAAALLAASVAPSLAKAQQAAIAADPPIDKAFPASMDSFQIPSHGAALNAIAYIAAGAGPHPVVLLLHGFPGNEKNLDLAQTIRRAGWTVVYFDYRGSWGTPGSFTFGGSLEDTADAIAYLRSPANAARLRIDPKRIVLLGHSMGGFMAAYNGAHDPGIFGIGLISAANMGAMAGNPTTPEAIAATRKALGASLEREDILPLAACTGESLAQELIDHRGSWEFAAYSNLFGDRPLLVITSDDGLAAAAGKLAQTAIAQGSKHVTLHHFATDHSYSDHRIALTTAVLNWLAGIQ